MLHWSILDRHIGKQVLLSVLFTLLVLIGLRTLFTLLDETGKLGEGAYGFDDALFYSLLLIPGRIYEFFPMSVLIGGLSALGILANQNELTVMRASGIKTATIVGSAVKVTILLMILVVALGEWVAPVLSQKAAQTRAQTLSDHKLSIAKSGVWARDGHDILHIDQIIKRDHLALITVFRLTEAGALDKIITAKEARFQRNADTQIKQWHLLQAEVQTPSSKSILKQSFDVLLWDGALDPEHVEVLSVEPEMLNLVGLHDYRNYLDANKQDSRRYQLEFWRKIAQPFTLIVMIVLASSFIFGPMRSVSMGARLMTGIVTGFTFHIINQFFGPISLVYSFPPMLGATVPMLLFAGFSGYLLKKAR